MHQDYYTLNNGQQAVSYIYKYMLGFSLGNAFKYCVRASRKPNNSAESDLNKALTYITSSNNEFSFIRRLIMRIRNMLIFNNKDNLSDPKMSFILESIIKFDSQDRIAKLIVSYMKDKNIAVNKEFEIFY